MDGLTPGAWVMIALCAVLIGVTKCGIPGFGILVVPLMAMVVDARSSTGLLLGILILGDLFAIGYYHRHGKIRHIVRLLPCALVGIVAGYFVMGRVTSEQLSPMIGGIVLLMLGINFWKERRGGLEEKVPDGWWFVILMGFLAGFTTMTANAAGPVMIIYLLAMRLDKMYFVGTSAWFFFVLNWAKVPFSASLDLMNAETIKINLLMIPFIALGAVIGIFALKRIPQKAFRGVVEILTALAAVKLFF